jgi:ribosomal protein S18 acetylase RimI-like enzyme
MMCAAPNRDAASSLPEGFTFDLCREDELDIWMSFPFNTPELATQYRSMMESVFANVYQPQREEFFRRCLFVRNTEGQPVATGFIWHSYGRIYTVQWIKTLQSYEGLGIGRALLSKLLLDLPDSAYPLYLHTHPESLRAIKLYTDFGFQLLTDPIIGFRTNDLEACMDKLREGLLSKAFRNLQFTAAPAELLDAAASSEIEDF